MNSSLRVFALGAMLVLLFTVSVSGEAFPEWIRHYSSQPTLGDSYAEDIVVNGDGNVYITGRSYYEGRLDMVTIKYQTDGSEAWISRYMPEGVTRSFAEGMVMDADGDLYVLGEARDESEVWNTVLVKYSVDGEIIWEDFIDPEPPLRFDGSDFRIDPEGNIIISGLIASHLAVVKYNSDGALTWYRKHDSPEGFGFLVAGLDVDAAGNVYLGGFADDGRSCIVKYSPDGEPMWGNTIHPDAYSYKLRGIRVDDTGDVFFLGERFNSENRDDWLIWKLSGAGESLWTFAYQGAPILTVEKYDAIADATVDEFGNLYVAGEAGNGDRSIDLTTMKILPDGTMDWIQKQDGGAKMFDHAADIYLDHSGNVYVCGSVCPPNKEFVNDFFVTMLDNSGVVLWARRYGPTVYYNQAARLCVDNNGIVYVTGEILFEPEASDSYATIKYVPMETRLGDANTDGSVNVADAVTLINYIFKGGAGPSPVEICDANCDSKINVGDIVYLIALIFREGPPCDCMH